MNVRHLLNGTWVLAAGMLLLAAVAAAQDTGRRGGRDFSTWTPEQKAEFLREGEVVNIERLDVGVTRSSRARLRHNGIEHDAHWQTIDVTLAQIKIGNRIHRNFRDSYLYNIAAYEVDRLLSLGMVPVTVQRRVKKHGEGAMAWWVDDVQMMERERKEKGTPPPDRDSWRRKIRRYASFSQLIGNIDPNATNLLITNDWAVWLIDFTRAFRTNVKLMKQPELHGLDDEMLAALENLDKAELRRALSDVLTGGEISAILRRRDRLVARFTEPLDP